MTELERNRYDYEIAKRERERKKWMHTNIDQTDGKNVAEDRKKLRMQDQRESTIMGFVTTMIIVGSPLTRGFDPSTCR